MGSFIKQIETKAGSLPFCFTSLHTINGRRYLVTVIEKQKSLYLFYMKRFNSSWHIEGGFDLPDWLRTIEWELVFTIENQADVISLPQPAHEPHLQPSKLRSR
jgi:hypothetical protein